MIKYRDGVELRTSRTWRITYRQAFFTGADFMPPDMPANNWVPLGKGKIVISLSLVRPERSVGNGIYGRCIGFTHRKSNMGVGNNWFKSKIPN